MNQSREMAKIAVKALDDKKGNDIRIIDIHEVTVIADYFVIASGANRNQIQSMAENVEESLGRAGYEPRQIEGYGSGSWILMDYNDIVIHIFSEEDRLFYDLDRIWRDGKIIETTDFLTE